MDDENVIIRPAQPLNPHETELYRAFTTTIVEQSSLMDSSFLQQSLKISQEIGDVLGLCATLFNMGHIHWQNKEIQEAVSTWITVYRLAK